MYYKYDNKLNLGPFKRTYEIVHKSIPQVLLKESLNDFQKKFLEEFLDELLKKNSKLLEVTLNFYEFNLRAVALMYFVQCYIIL